MATAIFGQTGQEVTRVGLGGEGVLRTFGRTGDAREVIEAAIDHGIAYFDSARVYADSEVYYGSVWQARPETRFRIFQASKSASRDKRGALMDLAQTLGRLKTDYLDLWQIHDVRTADDLAAISGPGGALEAFLEAKSTGKARWIGVTGHHDPRILTAAVRQWPVDAVMLPVNPVEGVLGGFLTSTLPAAREKGLAIIAMKVLGAFHYIVSQWGVTAELLIRYALSYDVAVVIVGCARPAEVHTLATAGGAPPLSEAEKSRLVKVFEPYAPQLAYYRGKI
ncbi:MAG: aldo/keto reductase [Desulfobacterales bacterium]|nr:MAG: aldo/keto reductase [Desulfobacterales bacterium]